ncbi:MAG: hypothetical protein U0894_02610 [Pirellulales bacterium]
MIAKRAIGMRAKTSQRPTNSAGSSKEILFIDRFAGVIGATDGKATFAVACHGMGRESDDLAGIAR